MTWRQQPAIWKVEGLRPTEKLVLLALAYFSNQDGSSSYPAQKTLAAMCAWSGPTIKRSLKSLRDRHLIIVEDKRGRRGTVSYKIDLPLAPGPAHKGVSPATPGGDHGRATIQLTNKPINKRDSYFNSSSTGDQFQVDDLSRLDSAGAVDRVAARRKKTYGR